ncbi:hypothetical protein L226DRAFT_261089 [Lentinus tigrinus ALCF2SS1-7]|uniref:SigF-like NTF2-like domain-containing protein n=1 Tax=Lentinus tigrinus ALCF2SS1-6 TaxID=1328759 RepID=A0A5C2RSD3_9APHY|nr:hypothetical protein L227DRAFT_657471 [Lentinus tigrinus ALCF2SS1-6]RPD70054.1 hypothetical protein L226DRAFT_261089 [Lentinus tigrinus ALCF2SS1-7]
MEDPAKEIADVALLVTAAVNPEVQKAAVLKYYAADMRFRHPLCAVSHAPHSRDAMLSILQWYRIMSPILTVHVNGVTYDAEKNAAFLEITQVFHIRWSPLKPAPSRLIVHLTLRPEPSPTDPSKTIYVIAEHEDFYHPDDLAALVTPPLIPLIRLGLHAATLACRVNARVFEALGYWSVKDGEGGQGVALRPEGEPLPPIGAEEQSALELDGKRTKDE